MPLNLLWFRVKNACALHYNSNDAFCKDEDMVLVDFEFVTRITPDTTRCIP
jgi:Xaa-Pro aminopeptidase